MPHQFTAQDEFRCALDIAAASLKPWSDDDAMPYTVAHPAIQSALCLPNDFAGSDGDGTIDPVTYLSEIAKQVTLASILLELPLAPYFQIAHSIRDALTQHRVAPKLSRHDSRWIRAMEVALTFNNGRNQHALVKFNPQARHVTLAHAVKFFASKSISLSMVDDKVIFKNVNEMRVLAATVDQPLKALGEERAMHLLGSALTARCDPMLQRVRLHPTPDGMGHKMDRAVPYGYMYRMALRSLQHKGNLTVAKATFKSAETAATHIGALFDVEPFSIYEDMLNHRSPTIMADLRKIVTYDELFTIPQCSPITMGNLLRDLLSDSRIVQISNLLGWKSMDIWHLWEVLLELSAWQAQSTFIKRAELQTRLSGRVGAYASDALIKAFVLEKPNRDYQLPMDAGDSHTAECAVVSAAGNRLWIAAQLFLGPAFYSRMHSVYISKDADFSTHIGGAFEERMFKKLNNLGIKCIRGDLGSRKVTTGDADLIVESENTIALFELKKKGLRRRTMGGDDLQLSVDLSRGLIHGMGQLAKQELSLMRDGALRFKDGSTLERKGRKVLKVVISLADHGGLHQVTTVHCALRSLCGGTIRGNQALTDEQNAELIDANEILQTFGNRFSAYRNLVGDDLADNFFENTLFHNIFYVEYLLESVRTAEEFVAAVVSGSRTVTGTRDAIVDHNYFRGARALAKSKGTKI